ncbi:MAG: response regulator transcription factor [Hyphomicrobiaceae bacterium]
MRILVVEDEIEIAKDIAECLGEAGFAVQTCDNGEDAWFLGSTEIYDAIILDLGLPRLDGLTVLTRWRTEEVTTPIIVLTARGSWTERVEGINAGADDYIPKPFQMEELIARLRSLLRRAHGKASPQIKAGQLELDTNAMLVTVDGRTAQLTPLEFRLISYLLHNKGRVVSREELKDHIYASDEGRVDNAVEAMIARLRRKLGFNHIETRRGHGYCLRVTS